MVSMGFNHMQNPHMLGDEAFSVEQTIPLGGMTPLFLNVQRSKPVQATSLGHDLGNVNMFLLLHRHRHLQGWQKKKRWKNHRKNHGFFLTPPFQEVLIGIELHRFCASWHKMGTGNIETLLRFGTLRAQSKDMCHKLISNITRFTSVKTETGVHHHHHLDLTRPPPAPIAPPPFWSRSPPRSARHADERCGCGSPLLARGPLLPSSARFRPVSAGLRATSNNQNGSSLNSNVPPEQLFFPMGGGIFQLYMGQALKMDDTQKRKPKLTEKMMITLILVVLCFFQTNPNITCCCFFAIVYPALIAWTSWLYPSYPIGSPDCIPVYGWFMVGFCTIVGD